MPQAQFIHDGDAIDYTPGVDVAAGDVVVLGDLVGVAKREIKAGVLGALAVTGVFDFAKANDSSHIVGTLLYWDDTTNIVTGDANAGKQVGKVVRDAATTDATVRVRLGQ